MTKLSKLLSIGALTCGLAFASTARAEDVPKGWDTNGLLFSLDNIFQNPTVLEGYQSFGLGGLYALSPKTALRLGLGLNHATNPAYVREQTTTDAAGVATTTKTLVAPTNYTSAWSVHLGGDFLLALTEAAVQPYVGAGASLSYVSSALAYTDDTVANNVLKVDNSDSTFNFGVRGIAGVQWRVHKSFALFAEYALNINLLNVASHSASSTTTTPAGSTSTKTTGAPNNYFNFGTGLNQGGSLGLIAFF
jgi:opacity protein-like surface antigen